MIVTVGGVESPTPSPLPVTIVEAEPPAAAKDTVALAVVVVVGVKRTRTAWLAPGPVSANGLPDTMLNGGEADAVPDTVPLPVFDTVNVCSAKLPRLTLPKFTGPDGLTANSARATALATVEQALSLPPTSTALTAT